jgi:hypothetical protein
MTKLQIIRGLENLRIEAEQRGDNRNVLFLEFVQKYIIAAPSPKD